MNDRILVPLGPLFVCGTERTLRSRRHPHANL